MPDLETMRLRSGRYALISALLVVPCFWQRQLHAGDLSSHVYNAWLESRLDAGHLPGLSIKPIFANTLFDRLLSLLGPHLGWNPAAEVACALAVLLFFWGTFAFAAAFAGEAAWWSAPLLAMLAYGWTFQRGFMNYYLSMGFAFLALAIVARARSWRGRALSLCLLPPMLCAHPLGVVIFFSVAAYLVIARQRLLSWPIQLGAGALAVLLGCLALHLILHSWGGPFSPVTHNGVDQVLAYPAHAYRAIFAAVAAIVAWVAIAAIRKRDAIESSPDLGLVLQLCALAQLLDCVTPDGVQVPGQEALSWIAPRITLISCVFIAVALAMLAAARRGRQVCLLLSITAIGYFALLYRDTARVNRLEQSTERLVASIPRDARVVARFHDPPELMRFVLMQVLDRACIGRCYAFNNYEPSTRQFRLRAEPGNGFVRANEDERKLADRGIIESGGKRIPVFEIGQCRQTGDEICIHPLVPGASQERATGQVKLEAPTTSTRL
jgi:hypothetical protein